MSCDLCAQRSREYRLTQLCCCVRLVLSAYPSKAHAAGMLATIDRVPGAPKRQAVLDAVKESLTSREAACA